MRGAGATERVSTRLGEGTDALLRGNPDQLLDGRLNESRDGANGRGELGIREAAGGGTLRTRSADEGMKLWRDPKSLCRTTRLGPARRAAFGGGSARLAGTARAGTRAADNCGPRGALVARAVVRTVPCTVGRAGTRYGVG
jgi:hypothetical protein